MAQRVGLIVPSSNVTIETEIPALLGHDNRTYHSSRAVMRSVDQASLHDMVRQGPQCARQLADADVDVIAYGCLVALMAEGHGAHEQVEDELLRAGSQDGRERPVVSSAGALVRTLQHLRLKQVVTIAPYSPDLTDMVLKYISSYGVETTDHISLNVTDNQAVACLDPSNLLEMVQRLDLTGADGIILSSCVQMPSLAAIAGVQDVTGLPVVTAATATARELLVALRDDRVVEAGGAALDGWLA